MKLKCKEVLPYLNAYLDAELSEEQAREVIRHVEVCETCRARFEQISLLNELLVGSLPVPPVPEGFAARVIAMARSRVAQRHATAGYNPVRWWRPLSLPMRAAAAAVLVVGMFTGIHMGRSLLPMPAVMQAARASSQADPLAQYNLDYLSDAPSGSLAECYLALVSNRNREGR